MFNLHFLFVVAVCFRPFHTTLNIQVFGVYSLLLHLASLWIFLVERRARERGAEGRFKVTERKINELAAFNELNAHLKCQVESFIALRWQLYGFVCSFNGILNDC